MVQTSLRHDSGCRRGRLNGRRRRQQHRAFLRRRLEGLTLAWRNTHLGRQVLGFNQLRRRHHGQPVTDIFQLPYIAGKGKTAEPGQCCVRNPLGLHAELQRTLLQEVARQHGHIFLALTQGRQAQADHIEAVKQVLAKCTLLDALFQILVRRGNDAYIGLDRAVAANAIEMAIAEHAQQPGLQVKWHVANLVEKQRAAVGLLKAATTHGLRTGEGTTLVAEQLGLEQVFRNRRRVDRDKGSGGAC